MQTFKQIRLFYYHFDSQKLKYFLITIYCVFFAINSFATDYYQRQSGNWNNSSTWTTETNWPQSANTGTYPHAGDNIHIANNGHSATITLTADAECANLYFDNSCTASVIAMGNYNLTISGSWTSDEGNNGSITQSNGYLQINGGIGTVSPGFKISKTIQNLRIGSGFFALNQYYSTSILTVTSNYDFNCFQSIIPTGINASGATKRNATPCNPVLSATTLTSFGSTCMNSSIGPYSFTISGLSLTNANITIGALSGFSYSTSENGTYSNTLLLTQNGGNYSQVIYVKFTPIYAITYNGNIVVGGGGASNINIPAVGSGVASVAPIVNTPTAVNITSFTANLGGAITVDGCSSQTVTERGIYYSTTSGFANGAGTKVSETGTFGIGAFSVNVTGLSASTTFYYKAFATNSSGTGYSAQGTFNNSPRTYYSRQSGNWTDPLTWSTVGGNSVVNDGTYPQAGDNVILCQPNTSHVVTVNTTVLSCNNLDMTAYATRLILNNDFTVNGKLTLTNQSYVSADTYNFTIKGDFSCIGNETSTRIAFTSGNIIINGNISASNSNISPFNCSGTGWLIMNGISKTFTVNSDMSIPRFRQPLTGFTKAGANILTISTIFDRNCGPAPTISAGIFTASGSTVNANCNPTKIFRSNTVSGNWSDAISWQQSTNNGSTWVTATAAPIITDGSVTIQNGHSITLTSNAGVSNLIVNGTIDLSTYTLSGTGSLSIISGGTMLVGGTSNFPSGFSNVTLNTGNTINYYSAGDQIVSPLIYDKLTLSGSGTKTTTGVTVNGVLSLEGTVVTTASIVTNAATTTLQFKGSTIQNITSNLFNGNKTGNMIIANKYGVNLNTDFTINNNLTINSGTSLVIQPAQQLVASTVSNLAGNSGIVIKASPTSVNGSFIFYNLPGNSVNGTVEMYSKAFASTYDSSTGKYSGYKWQYFGSPITKLQVAPTFNGSYVRKWVESGTTIANHWIQLQNTDSIYSFLGYEITQPTATTIVFQGKLVNSNYSSGQLPYTSSALYSGQHVLANPYTAAIDIRQLSFGSDMEWTVYLYNSGSYNDWTTMSGATNTGNNSGQYTSAPKNLAGNQGIPRQIPSMQGFLVKSMSNSANATLSMQYSSSIIKNADQQRSPNKGSNLVESEMSSIIIDVKGSHFSDRMWLFTSSNCSHNFDNGYDGVKIIGSIYSPQLYAVEPDNNYQIDCVDDMNNTILGFQAGEDSTYVMTFTSTNIKNKYAGLYLIDVLENKIIDISESGSTYVFGKKSDSQNRFKIVTRLPEIDVDNMIGTKINLLKSGNILFVENKSNLKGELSIYDLVGHNLGKICFGANQIVPTQLYLNTGIYVLQASIGNERVSKLFIQK